MSQKNTISQSLAIIAVIITTYLPIGLNAQSDISGFFLKKTYQSEEEYLNRIGSDVKYQLTIEGKQIKLINRETKEVANHITILNFPDKINTLILSPNNKSFIAFQEEENETKYLYFYSIEGKLYSRKEINVYPHIKYSEDGKYVELFNMFGNKITIFNDKGGVVYERDYTKLIKNKIPILYNIFMIENGKNILVNSGHQIHLISTLDDNIIWTKPSNLVTNCFFDDKSNMIIIKTLSKKQNPHGKSPLVNLIQIKFEDGSEVGSINGASRIDFSTEKLIVKKQKLIYEYVLK